ncbi:MAG: type II secretion system protein [Phycisphaerae bacterium]
MRILSGNMRGGFTLIELLVVIAILSLLITILVPSLAGAQEHARTAKCLANLRNIGTSMQQYSSQTGKLPASYVKEEDGGRSQWIHHLAVEVVPDLMKDDPDLPGQLTSFRCPSEVPETVEIPDEWPGGDVRSPDMRFSPLLRRVLAAGKEDSNGNIEFWAHTSYGINGGNIESHGFASAWRRRGSPHKWVGGATGRDWLGSDDYELPLDEIISVFDGNFNHVSGADMHSSRHGADADRINVLCQDGHVESLPNEKVSQLSNAYGGSYDIDPDMRPSHGYKRD